MDISDLIDDDGYPTDKAIHRISTWRGDRKALMDYIRRLWHNAFEQYWSENELADGRTEYHISTGGWSGNEDIIRAMKENALFWSVCWVQSRRGGHYIFEVR